MILFSSICGTNWPGDNSGNKRWLNIDRLRHPYLLTWARVLALVTLWNYYNKLIYLVDLSPRMTKSCWQTIFVSSFCMFEAVLTLFFDWKSGLLHFDAIKAAFCKFFSCLNASFCKVPDLLVYKTLTLYTRSQIHQTHYNRSWILPYVTIWFSFSKIIVCLLSTINCFFLGQSSTTALHKTNNSKSFTEVMNWV